MKTLNLHITNQNNLWHDNYHYYPTIIAQQATEPEDTKTMRFTM